MNQYYYQLPAPVILIVEGRDAPRYLNARLTNDIKTLAVGDSLAAGALNAQGRTQAFFRVKRLEAERFLLTCDGGDREGVISAFKKFIVADRVTVTDLSDDYVLIHATGEVPALPSSVMSMPSERLRTPGIDYVVPRLEAAGFRSAMATCLPLTLDHYTAERIAAGVPSFPEELNEGALFSEAPLPNAVSFKKGCYVGQEVVEKIDARGKLAHLLRVVKVPGAVTFEPETQVTLEGQPKPIGEIVSAAYHPSEGVTYAFASLKNLSEVTPGARIKAGTADGEVIR